MPSANRWIHFENYIIRSDTVGLALRRALVARAREGVQGAGPVRLARLALHLARASGAYLRRAGVEVRGFHPPRPLDLVTNFSRNHRKLVVADGSRAVIGGLCIGCEWTGERPSRRPALARHGGARSPAPPPRCSTRRLPAPGESPGGACRTTTWPAWLTPEGDAEVRVIGGEPGRERTYRVIELLAAGSVERLWITDAYLVAPPRLFQALRDAARDGVDVRLLVPGSSDLPLVRNLSRIGYRDLLRSGVRIYEWDGPMLHAKTIVADGRWVRVGSSNLNPSSLIGNYELDVLVEDAVLGEAHGTPVPPRHRAQPGGDPPAAPGAAAHQSGAADRAGSSRARHRGRTLPPPAARGGTAGGAGPADASPPTRAARSSCRSRRCSCRSACCSSSCRASRPTCSG